MNTPNDGGPFFPSEVRQEVVNKVQITDPEATRFGETVEQKHWEIVKLPGISLRDWLAGMALQGILAANAKCADEVTDRNVDYVVAREAYASADAMLAERTKTRVPSPSPA